MSDLLSIFEITNALFEEVMHKKEKAVAKQDFEEAAFWRDSGIQLKTFCESINKHKEVKELINKWEKELKEIPPHRKGITALLIESKD